MQLYDFLTQLYHLLLPIAFLLNIVFAVTIVFVRRKNPQSVPGWLLVLFLLPILGCFLYLVFGQSYRKEKMFRVKAETDRKVTEYLEAQVRELKSRAGQLDGRWAGAYHRMALLLLQDNRAIITTNNDITPYTDGKAKFADLLTAIGNAKDHVHL